jgi:hypothetical protein
MDPDRIPAGLDLVVQIKASGAAASFEEIRLDLIQVLERVRARWAEQSESSL